MHLTLTFVLDSHELYLIDKVKQAFDLASMDSFVRDLQNPFPKIFDNYFSLDDLYAANDMLRDACEIKSAQYKSNRTEFGDAVLARCEKAQQLFNEFYVACEKEVGDDISPVSDCSSCNS